MLITFCVIAYNEENSLPRLFENILLQDYDHKKIEIIFVDSASSDNTKKVMRDFSDKYKSDFYDIIILDNPKKILPAGWNVALKKFNGEAIVKVDAHAQIPNNFVSENVNCMKEGEYVSGGRRPNIIDDETPWNYMLLAAESSMFGSSIATYRNSTKHEYVKSLFHAMYHRKVIQTIGGFNENLVRTEDNDFNNRIRQAGFKLCMSPRIISYQHIRTSLKKMIRQKYLNGYWIALTSAVESSCLSLFHFVPFIFVIAILISFILLFFGNSFIPTLLYSSYSVVAILMTVMTIYNDKQRSITYFVLPIIFLLLHISYGLGSLKGFLHLPSFIKKYEECKEVEEVKTIVNEEI